MRAENRTTRFLIPLWIDSGGRVVKKTRPKLPENHARMRDGAVLDIQMTIAQPDKSVSQQERPTLSSLLWVAALIAVMTAMRCIFAGTLDLRTDEAYYWTWSKESALSFLDHPPMIAWFIRFGTAIFGDTNFGVRFAGLLAMPISQLLLADIVRRVTHDIRAAMLAVLMMEATLYYGLLMAKVAPDVALIPFELAMVWSLVRLTESGNARWWLAAGLFGGLSLLSKLTALMLLPAIAAFIVVPDWRWRWLRSPYPWAAALIAVTVFSPVLIWNGMHDWASFRFQFVRAIAAHDFMLRTLGDYIGLQFGQVGPILLPVVLFGVGLTAWRGYRHRDPVAVLLSTAVLVPFIYFLWKSTTLRVGDTWPMLIWPLGFAAAAIDIATRRREKWPAWIEKSSAFWVNAAIASGLVLVAAVFLYYTVSPWNFIGKTDPIGGEAGFAQVASRVESELQNSGATWIATDDYRIYAMLRWHLKDRVPVIQINERSRFIGFRDPGLSKIAGHAGLYIARKPDDTSFLASTSAVLTPLGEVQRVWRGRVMDTYVLEKLTGWTPDLSPPPDSPLYKWRQLAEGAATLPRNGGSRRLSAELNQTLASSF
jgi:4-amino-4-deoxy-L-arabinose transferase-like glycosyltransferase